MKKEKQKMKKELNQMKSALKDVTNTQHVIKHQRDVLQCQAS